MFAELESKNKLNGQMLIKKILKENIKYVVQINGKKRGIINLTNEFESELIIKIKNNLINKLY